jgi:hypothetical protein
MNKKDLMLERNRNKQKLHKSFSFKVNVVKNKANTSLSHSVTKARICYYLERLGLHYVTEAIFGNQKRADIYVLDKDKAIEIVDSESAASIEVKKVEYPCAVSVVSVGQYEDIDEDFVEKLVN